MPQTKGTAKNKQKTPARKPGRPVVRQTLAEVRERRALSLSELGALAHVDRSTIYEIEHGRRRPFMHTRRKLAAALQVPVDSIGWEG